MAPAKARIAVLVDNRSGQGLATEHGLSLWIEADGKRILFDAGQGEALAPNARALGVDLAGTDVLVLSHGHYDHAGGVGRVLACAPALQAYVHPGAMQTRYAIRNGAPRPIHMPRESRAALARLPAERLHFTAKGRMLSENVGVTGAIPRETDFEDPGGPFFLDPDGTKPDPIEDDQALWVRTAEGVVVCVGCSHAGLINTLREVVRQSGEARIRAVIGGFHLLQADAARLRRTLEALAALDPGLLVPCHCTGEAAAEAFHNALGERAAPGAAGMTFRF